MKSDGDVLPIPPILDPVLLNAVMALAKSARFYKHLFLLTANALGLDEVVAEMTDDDKAVFQVATLVTNAWSAQFGLDDDCG